MSGTGIVMETYIFVAPCSEIRKIARRAKGSSAYRRYVLMAQCQKAEQYNKMFIIMISMP